MGIVADTRDGRGWSWLGVCDAEVDLFVRAAVARELCATICVNFQGWNGWYSR